MNYGANGWSYEDMHIYMHKGRRKREIIPIKVTSYLTHLLMDN